jgi:endonuclease YncB( thermonuclease family)
MRTNRFQWLALISLILVGAPGPGFAESVSGLVVGITDGDTFTLLTDNKQQLKVRVAEIDAPERGQPYGSKSRQVLASLIFQKDVSLEIQVVDNYGRLVGRPMVGSTDISAEMIRNGAAWIYRTYCDDPTMYEIEKQATKQQIGLWKMPEYDRVPPWEWRRGKRTKAANQPTPNAFECDAKTYCSEMVSCDEAKYHLKSCGLTRLDGDGDGVPCEAICR